MRGSVPMPVTPEFDPRKFRELILYIAAESVDDSRFGATKLAKILCWSDFLTYAQTGKAITGATYCRFPYGPYPEELEAAEADLIKTGDVDVYVAPSAAYPRRRLLPRRAADLSQFSAEEISIVDHVMEGLRTLNARQASDLSHERLVGWQLAAPYEAIPYTTIFLSPDPPSEDDIAWARRVAAEQGALRPVGPRQRIGT